MKFIISLLAVPTILLLMFILIPLDIPSFDLSGNAWSLINWLLDMSLMSLYWFEYLVGAAVIQIMATCILIYLFLRYVVSILIWIWEKIPFN